MFFVFLLTVSITINEIEQTEAVDEESFLDNLEVFQYILLSIIAVCEIASLRYFAYTQSVISMCIVILAICLQAVIAN